MKHIVSRWYPHVMLITILVLGLFFLASCAQYQSSTTQPSFYDVGANNITVTGSQLTQYVLYRFDTAVSNHTLTTPSAADIVKNYNPVVGDVLAFAVTADGTNSVTIAGGTNVTVKPSASVVAGNTTLMIFFEVENVDSGSEAVTAY